MKKRAIINQRMYFDAGTLFKSFYEYFVPKIHAQVEDVEKLKAVQTAVGFLNTFLEGHDYAAGDSLSVADFTLLASINTVDAVGFDFTDYPNVTRWFEHMKGVVKGYDECNEEGLAYIRNLVAAQAPVGDPEPKPIPDQEAKEASSSSEDEKEEVAALK